MKRSKIKNTYIKVLVEILDVRHYSKAVSRTPCNNVCFLMCHNMFHKTLKVGQLAKGKGHLTHEAHVDVVNQRSTGHGVS
jgi:hypothetical protein